MILEWLHLARQAHSAIEGAETFRVPYQKGKPLKKTKETDAIFANVKQVQKQVRNEPETLEISMDAKAKVGLGDYVRGGKNPDRCRR